ncbi:hypothetical protein F4859DRAFT_478707 [Xylaria cf. heliscus]|nr:hypothetical protein F4859DRAFT_478707 [Xylaria cf. heliscus]
MRRLKKNISKLSKAKKRKRLQATLDATNQTRRAPTTPTNVPSFPDGVKVWINPVDAEIDICFIHGLTGDRDATWTASGQSEPWPSNLLPDRLPKARLLTYGYDAYVVQKSVTSINTLNDHATNLLRDLTDDRESCNASSRRIVFVAHSLGGLICKEAILQSRNNPELHLREIFHSVIGVIFMGTPHTGSWIADWAKIPAHTLGVLKSTNMALLGVLRTENQLLQSIQNRFLSMVRELRENKRPFEVTCFFEELPLRFLDRVVVTRESATFEGYSLSSIHADHSDMVRFHSTEDNGFKRLAGDLIRWVRLPSSGKQVASTTTRVEAVGDVDDHPYYHECLRSLSFPEIDDRFKDIDHATKGTCEWLLRHRTYQEWVTDNQGLLWIKGKPGSGKSTLLQYALSNAIKMFGDGPLILSFFFHGRGVELQKTPIGFFRSLLHQLLYHVPNSLSELVTMFEKRCKDMGEPNEDWKWHSRELLEFIKSSLSTILRDRSVWLFVDALDECGKENAVGLAENFKALLRESPAVNSQFHICFTCRHYPILDIDHGLEICLEDENREDISIYIQNELASLRSMLPDAIPETIRRRASGVFLWTRLVIKRVKDLNRDGAAWRQIQEEINAIPDDLHTIYQDLIKRMRNGSASLKLIQWVCCATRPLSLAELRWAMVIDAKCAYQLLQECPNDLIVNDNRMKRQIQTLSCGLAEIALSSRAGSQSKEVVQFIHQSVKDFFLEKGLLMLDYTAESTGSAIGNAHYQLSRTCIRYLAMKEVGQSISFTHDDLMSRFPLLRYATLSWAWHEGEIKERTESQEDLLEYFSWPSEQDKLLKLWIKLHRNMSYSNFPREGVCIVHIASYYQFIGTLRRIIEISDERNLDINLVDYRNQTPLSLAAENGCEAAVRLLLDTGKVEIDSKDRYSRTPLSWAAENGREAVIQHLLNTGKVEIDSKDKEFGRTPLSWAAKNGRKAVVQLLLNTSKVKIDLKNKEFGRTPLS